MDDNIEVEKESKISDDGNNLEAEVHAENIPPGIAVVAVENNVVSEVEVVPDPSVTNVGDLPPVNIVVAPEEKIVQEMTVVVEDDKKEDINISVTLFESIYMKVLGTINKREVKAEDLVFITVQTMKLAQQQKTLSGPQKKELVTEILVKLVNDSGLLNEKEKAIGEVFLQSILPTMIDTIVGVAINNIDIGKVKDKCKTCCIIC